MMYLTHGDKLNSLPLSKDNPRTPLHAALGGTDKHLFRRRSPLSYAQEAQTHYAACLASPIRRSTITTRTPLSRGGQ